MENDRKASRGDVERFDLEILLRRPSLRASISRRVSQVRREEVPEGETNCGLGCVRGRWLQSFANRNSFALIYGILGSFYGAYVAYFYGVISTLEKRFRISSQTAGSIAAIGSIVQVLTCVITSRFAPKVHRPRWISVGVLLIVASTVVFVLPHFLYGPYVRGVMSIDVGFCKSSECRGRTEEKGPVVFFILAEILHGLGGGLYLTIGKRYEDENIEKYKPPALLSLLSVLKILGPAFGYWLSSLSLKFFEYPGERQSVGEDDARWIGAWWLGSLVIGFILLVPGLLMSFFPTMLPKTAVRRIHNKVKGVPEVRMNAGERNDKIIKFEKLFNSSTPTYTHFASIFNILGIFAYFIFLPKYVETQYRVTPSNANLIAGSITLISSAVGVVTANSVITRYRPTARALASWTVVVGILSISGVASYIFIGCQTNDLKIMEMAVQNLDCNCTNSTFSPVCDEFNQGFISPCHAGCESIPDSSIQGFKSCNYTAIPSKARNVVRGFCHVDCHSDFLIFIIITCSVAFTYATGRASNYWFETKSEESKGKSAIGNLGMILALVVTIPAPVVFGYLLDKACLLWEGNCRSGNCWLYDNNNLRLSMNLLAVGFAVIGILFDVGVWYSVRNLELFDDIEYYMDEADED